MSVGRRYPAPHRKGTCRKVICACMPSSALVRQREECHVVAVAASDLRAVEVAMYQIRVPAPVWRKLVGEARSEPVAGIAAINGGEAHARRARGETERHQRRLAPAR